MDEAKVSKNKIIEKFIFILIGAVLFLLLFGYSNEINYSDPITIIKLFVIAAYLLMGEKTFKFIFEKIKR